MKTKRKMSRVKYPNICRDAVRLGVHRVHLYQVLDGRRESASLRRRYRALRQKKAA